MDARVLPRGAGRKTQAKMRTSSAYADVDFADLANREPIIRSRFDVYLIDDNLIYAKTQCSEEDTAARFFASVFSVDPNRLPGRRGDYHGIDFDFHDHGAIDDAGRCWAVVDLPNYPIPIAKIEAGQYVELEDGYTHIWVGSYGEISNDDADAEMEMFERLAEREPIIRSDFDVYIIGDRLIYAKTDCDESDTEARFFASAFPLYAEALPDDVRRRGYENTDFRFDDYGAITNDGRCWADVRLPNYPIAEMHVGQYVGIGGRLQSSMGRLLPLRIAMSTMPTWKSKIAGIWRDRQKVAAGRMPFALFIVRPARIRRRLRVAYARDLRLSQHHTRYELRRLLLLLPDSLQPIARQILHIRRRHHPKPTATTPSGCCSSPRSTGYSTKRPRCSASKRLR